MLNYKFQYSSHWTIFVLFIGITFVIMIISSGPSQHILAISDLNFFAAGDWGCTGNTQKTVDIVKNGDPDILLALGDYSYTSTPDCWFDVVKPIDSITRINIGNHDDESPALLAAYLNHFGLNKPYYAYDVKNVHILTMNTEDEIKVGGEQYNFVSSDLQKASANPNIKWIIVNMHFPLYVSPNTCGDPACAGDGNLRDAYHPLFDKYGVDLVLQGHVHNYQRSYPLMYDSENPSSPIVTSCETTSYNNPEGQIYTIVGTGGVNLHGLSGKSSFMANQEDSKFGTLNIRSSADALDIKFIDNKGTSSDQFNITKTMKKPLPEKKVQEKNTSVSIENQNCAGQILFKEKGQTNVDSTKNKKEKPAKDTGKAKQEAKKSAAKSKDTDKGNKGGGKGKDKGNKGGGKGKK